MDSLTNLNSPPVSTTSVREIEEIAIAVIAKELNPTLLNPDFLNLSGIVPSDWQLSKQPIISPTLSQFSFKNGLTIVAQPRTVTFAETIGNQEQIQAAEVARRYVDKLPNAEYQTLNISPRLVAPQSDSLDAARRFITGTLLASGPWQEFGQAPLQAGVNFIYRLERCQLNLSVNEARLQTQDQKMLSALLFSGTFSYSLTGDNQQQRINQLQKQIDEWKTDLDIFREIIHQRFLTREESVFPASAFSQ